VNSCLTLKHSLQDLPGKRPPTSWLPTLKKAGLATLSLLGPALSTFFLPTETFLTPSFLDAPFLVK